MADKIILDKTISMGDHRHSSGDLRKAKDWMYSTLKKAFESDDPHVIIIIGRPGHDPHKAVRSCVYACTDFVQLAIEALVEKRKELKNRNQNGN